LYNKNKLINKMEYLDKYDNKNRYCGLTAILSKLNKPVKPSHGVSYLYSREQLQSIGMKMGFDKCVDKKLKSSYNTDYTKL
jgi:hypothetical protein